MKIQLQRSRNKGSLIPLDVVRATVPLTGVLSLRERKDYKCGRVLRTARLVDLKEPGDVDMIPELLDAQLLVVRGSAMTLGGFERDGNQDFAQAWQIEVIPEEAASTVAKPSPKAGALRAQPSRSAPAKPATERGWERTC